MTFSVQNTTAARKATRHIASPELCQVIESLFESSAVPARATLRDVRAALEAGIFVSGEGELLYPQDRTFLVIELDELIDGYGLGAAARDLTNP